MVSIMRSTNKQAMKNTVTVLTLTILWYE